MPCDWIKLNSKCVIKNKWIHLTENTFVAGENVVKPWYLLHYPDWVTVIPVTKDRKVLLVDIFRQGLGNNTLEFPSGGVDKTDNNELMAAKRELLEETGYGNGEWEFIAKIAVNTSTHTNYCYIFLAYDLDYVQEQSEEDKQLIEVQSHEVGSITNLFYEEKSVVGAQIAGYYLAKEKYPNIFKS